MKMKIEQWVRSGMGKCTGGESFGSVCLVAITTTMANNNADWLFGVSHNELPPLFALAATLIRAN